MYPSTREGHPTRDEMAVLARFAYTYSFPTIIRMRDERYRPDIGGGSGILMIIGGQRRLVTARHVIQGFRDEHMRDPAAIFDCMGNIIVPDAYLVDEEPTSDLAVLDVDAFTFERNQAGVPPIEFFEQNPFFGSDVNVGDRIFFGGWPKEYRDVTDGGLNVHAGFDAIINVPISGISDHEFCVDLRNRDGWESMTVGNTKPPDYIENRRLGGHSGAGVFKIHSDGERPQLVGFVKQDIDEGNGVVCCPITKLRTNGTVKPSSIGFVPLAE